MSLPSPSSSSVGRSRTSRTRASSTSKWEASRHSIGKSTSSRNSRRTALMRRCAGSSPQRQSTRSANRVRQPTRQAPVKGRWHHVLAASAESETARSTAAGPSDTESAAPKLVEFSGAPSAIASPALTAMVGADASAHVAADAVARLIEGVDASVVIAASAHVAADAIAASTSSSVAAGCDPTASTGTRGPPVSSIGPRPAAPSSVAIGRDPTVALLAEAPTAAVAADPVGTSTSTIAPLTGAGIPTTGASPQCIISLRPLPLFGSAGAVVARSVARTVGADASAPVAADAGATLVDVFGAPSVGDASATRRAVAAAAHLP